MQYQQPAHELSDALPSSRPAPEAECACLQPIPQERAERKGAARTYCARCNRPIPLRLGYPRRT